jgi:hypothetical protein
MDRRTWLTLLGMLLLALGFARIYFWTVPVPLVAVLLALAWSAGRYGLDGQRERRRNSG